MPQHLCDINETLIEEFLHQRVPDYVDPVSGYRRNHSRSPLIHLLATLRATGLIQPRTIDMTPVVVELRRFDGYLLQARGFAKSTRENSIRIVGRFLRERFDDGTIELPTITPEHVRNFLSSQANIYRTPTSFSMVVSSLRGYFRWCMMQDDDLRALTGALANPANWQQASLPKSLSIEEIEQLLAALGQTDPIGLRADAMVRCALDLGLRIGEIARLSLDDIDWETGTITLHRTKGRRDDVMPLPATTGKAIVAYRVRKNHVRLVQRDPLLRRLMYRALEVDKMKAMSALKIQIRTERDAIKASPDARPLSYRAWVEVQASQLDAAAVSQLRGWAYRQQRQNRTAPISGNVFLNAVADDVKPATIRGYETTVKRDGAVVYSSGGKPVLMDRGVLIEVADAPEERGKNLAMAMHITAQKSGERSEIRGETAFVRDAIGRIPHFNASSGKTVPLTHPVQRQWAGYDVPKPAEEKQVAPQNAAPRYTPPKPQ